MPIGAVIYAGNNSRLKGFALRDNSGKLLGFLATNKLGGLVLSPVKGSKTHVTYTVNTFSGIPMQVTALLKLERKGNEARSPVSGVIVGTLGKEEVVNAQGELKIRNDSSGMFEVVAAKLKKIHSIPPNLVKRFANVHDDLGDDGTKEDSKTNFFNALKSMPGVGGASELDFFAYSGHGSGSGLPSAGIGRGDISKLKDEIKRLVRADGTVILYACSTGTPKGFAEQLSGQLPGMTVWGHLPPPGPASINPRKVKFKAGKSQNFLEQFTKEERVMWDNHVKSSSDFYARYPFMRLDEIRAEIGMATVGRTPAPTDIQHTTLHAARATV
ncbi:MAG: hypothetical protein K1X57_14595 [Gemmataceae bacterium]|nr:hypothetical protein [Gemmataceae bacterium]